MKIEVTWLGHATWLMETDEHRILLDPFLNDSPTAPRKASEVDADWILVSHGHFDHVADVAEIANRCNSTVVAIYEIADWFAKQHQVANTIGMNLGGTVSAPWGSVKMVPALHSSQLPDGSYGGVAAGLVVTMGERKLYFACDTALFSDMKLIGEQGLDLAVLPIGDLFTMGPQDAVTAAGWLNARQVMPTHYGTWPPIEQDAEAWAQQIREQTSSNPIVLQPGESHLL